MKVSLGNFLRLINKHQQNKVCILSFSCTAEGFHPIANVIVLLKVLLHTHKPGHFLKGQCKTAAFKIWCYFCTLGELKYKMFPFKIPLSL